MADQAESQGEAERVPNRRKALVRTGQVLGGLAVTGSVYPFISSMQPSRRTKAEGAPLRADLSDVSPGEMISVSWRRKPVWIIRRNPRMIEMLSEVEDSLTDPESESSVQPKYCRNRTRSIRPDVFVAIGICTHLGCIPGLNGENGFLCACHGSKFDFAGRVFSGSPAPSNLVIPPHHFVDEEHVVVGENPAA